MTTYHFPIEAGAAIAGSPPNAHAITGMLDRFGLPAAGLRIGCSGSVATLEGSVPDDSTRERVVLAVGNLQGIEQVDDRLTVAKPTGLLDMLGSFARLPAGAASTEAAETAVHRATPEPGTVFGPAGSLLHTVQPGETLADIASRHYGGPGETRRILEANAPILADAGALRPGMVLRLPPR
ncbi:BON domain-containing protein [Siccirubricoccus sp. G192]|uniref:BON domain-containing protein n=1 Tax=Siccirubricoccus sp. G192 TaxID=2849651 RepID=UPI001C2CADCF|nr:BON domain-containing protein [Siccirubricoccus sp. G192]MBV1800183.1 LysM peptidoglycan-binding domain-containing protein [Siccirubricoccus sp. G192]